MSQYSVPAAKEDIVKKLRSFTNRKVYLKSIVPKRLEHEEELDPQVHNPIDVNDKDILHVQGEMSNMLARVDAYILERVMFAALSFSGFLTIIAADKGKFHYEDMKSFGENLGMLLVDILTFDIKGFTDYQLFCSNNSDEHLLIIIMFETLICSFFFLLVITTRLKFAKLADELHKEIDLARSYNDKEEEVYLIALQRLDNEVLTNRLITLNLRIRKQLLKSSELIREIQPVINFMSLFRNLGVFFFLMVLITSLFFFHPTIAYVFFFLAVSSYLYKEFDEWLRKKRL